MTDDAPTATSEVAAPYVRVPLEHLPRLQNDRLIRAVKREPLDRAPVWVMRQAGRYLPEFRAFKESTKADFFEICQTPEMAVELTLQPHRRYRELDAIIIFSDILIIPQAMGMEVTMHPGKGPVFTKPLTGPEDLSLLTLTPDVLSSFGYLLNALNLARVKVDGKVPLIGFAGGPWTLMAYMIEGGGSKTFADSKKWLFTYPEESHRLISAISDIIAALLIEQYRAGAQYLQVFESSSGELTPRQFQTFLLPYLKRIATTVKAAVPALEAGGPPLVVFPRGSHYALEWMCDTDYDVVGLDWSVDPATACSVVKGRKVLQGNFDPCALYAPAASIRENVGLMLQDFGSHPVVLNLGHGMHPTHTPEQLGAFFAAVDELAPAYAKH